MGCGQSTATAEPTSIVPAAAPQPEKASAPADSNKDQAAATAAQPASVTSETKQPPEQAPPAATAAEATEKSSAPSNSSSPPAPVAVANGDHIAAHLDSAAELEHKLRNMSSSPAAAAPAANGQDAPPAWKSFTPAQLAAIEDARAIVRAKGPLVMDPKGTYGLICRACTKPNSTNVTFCTGCSFPSTVEDIQRLPDNIFKLLVDGEDIGAKVHYRDADSIVFSDKFPVSDNHLDVIPTEVYADCTVLTKEHIPVLERLYELGKQEFISRNIAWLPKDVDIDEFITAGYNYPVSVKHLHLHMVLPPFKHEKVFQYPRWHSHKKVVADLKQHGAVKLYCDAPNEEEGTNEYQRAMKNSEKAKELQAKHEESKNAAPAQ